MPPGLMPDMTYKEIETPFLPGEGLLLYTDGIVEAHNGQLEMFGLPRLIGRLTEGPCGPETIEHLLASLAEFTGPDREQEDDVTLVVMSCSPKP
jgi:serine phosphatase RsbU (regulator of sigma subunit)